MWPRVTLPLPGCEACVCIVVFEEQDSWGQAGEMFRLGEFDCFLDNVGFHGSTPCGFLWSTQNTRLLSELSLTEESWPPAPAMTVMTSTRPLPEVT